jgi:hypothetical protein
MFNANALVVREDGSDGDALDFGVMLLSEMLVTKHPS